METQLFNWDEWDIVQEGIYQFYNIVTKIPLGTIPAETKFDCATVDYQTGVLQFVNNNGDIICEFDLKMQAVPRLK